MTYNSLLRSFCLLSLLLLGHMSRAQIFSNPITDINPGLSNPYTSGQVESPNVTVGGIKRSGSIMGVNGDNLYNTRGWNDKNVNLLDYLEFTITPNAGYNLNFTSFVYTAQVASVDGPTSFAFRSSLDNYTANIGTPTVTGTTISLAAAAYQYITTSITFRLYAWNAKTPNDPFGILNFAFNGAVAVALPIELTAFHAEAIDGRTAKLAFSTATERNNNYFAIERSQDGTRFETIGQVPGAGNSSVPQDYSYVDQHPAKGLNFYRLKQVDFDGQFAYSPVVMLRFGQPLVLRLSPQPVYDQVRVQLEQPAAQDSPWELYDFAGRLLQSGILEAEAAEFRIFTASLTEGSYVLRLVSGASVLTQQFQKR